MWVCDHGGVPPFSFLTNHGLALLCIAEDPRLRMRDIAAHIDITERAAQRIVSDLIETGYLTRTREGRRNSYTVRTDLPVALAAQRDIDLGSLLEVLLPAGSSAARRGAMTADGTS
jgi:DNA-binding MarR family transcriptional regulator